MNHRGERNNTDSARSPRLISSCVLFGCILLCLVVGVVGGTPTASLQPADPQPQQEHGSERALEEASPQLTASERVAVRVDDLSSSGDNSSQFITSYDVSRIADFDRVEIEYDPANGSGEQVETLTEPRGSSGYRSDDGFGGGYEITIRVYDTTEAVVGERTISATANGTAPVADDLATESSPEFDSTTITNLSVARLGYAQYELSYAVDGESYNETRAFLVGVANGTGTDERRSADSNGTLTLNGRYDDEHAFELTALVLDRDGVVVDSITEGIRGGDTTTTAAGRTAETGDKNADKSPDRTWATATAVGGVSLVVALGGLLWLARRRTDAPSTSSQRPESTDRQTTPREPTGATDTPPAAEPTATSADTSIRSELNEGSTDTSDPPEHLLSNEERILRLIRENGGRIKQQRVVSEFDWSAARTSQLVGELREDGKIDVFRLGRENVLRLPDEDD